MARQKVKTCPRCEKRDKFKKWGYCKPCNNEKRKEAAKGSVTKIYCERMGAMMEQQDCTFVESRCGSCKSRVKGNPVVTPELTLAEMREQTLMTEEEPTFPDHYGA